jgi:DNA-binding transcriptional LysR family regulator
MERRNVESASGTGAIELRHLRYFLAVSEELHFRRAAQRLYMAQPPLSQAIRRLEGALGVQLLRRTSRAVSLTEAGRVFAAEARKTLVGLDRAVAETRHAGGSGWSLRIGYAPYLPIGPLLRFLDGLRAREPLARPQVRDLVEREQVQRLQDGELDLGIVPSAGVLPGLESAPLTAGEPLAVFLRPDHPLAEKLVLAPADLAGETLVSFGEAAEPSLAAWLGEQRERAGYGFRALVESGADTRDWILAVAAGTGIALLPSSAHETADAGAVVVRRPLDPPLTMPDTVVAWRARPPAGLRALTDDIRAVACALRETNEPLESRDDQVLRSRRPG